MCSLSPAARITAVALLMQRAWSNADLATVLPASASLIADPCLAPFLQVLTV